MIGAGALSLNQATVRHADLETALQVAVEAGIGAVGLWREPVHEMGLERAAQAVTRSGLRVSSLCRGGFVTAADEPARTVALDDNRRAIEETAVLAAAGAEGSAAVLVLVPGGLPEGDRDLGGARERVAAAVAELAPDADAAGVTLAVEPMNPIYAADRGVISTLGQALDIAEAVPGVGVVVDTFHVWWDPELAAQVERAGNSGRIAAFQVCDWITPLPPDTLLARGMMGDGHIDFRSIANLVEAAGYRGDVEVEIFNQQVWDADPAEVARRTARAFVEHVGGARG
ncbi:MULTISPECIES: sugar phosphate isomerase/epimerase family protein [unclassified Pseudonocardia]|uniref:sugar phosphate isomerase/epimerase family protein n=1 Tax=unclassified Pseudonocardia TaxID=2619320 RepID=UPI0001FFE5DA|nr:sugar phosphate isomerase/epimerase family protein [Pseudonocardia sp. Ae707_Ps1]OLM20391.1 Sugar phosphate isomerase/epimerase [Pseudonocardia sp. Ae707_Ps1]